MRRWPNTFAWPGKRLAILLPKATDVFFVGPPGVGKTHLAQAIGYEAIKMGFAVLYRSIFDLVNDFLKDEAFSQHERTCASTSNRICSSSVSVTGGTTS